VRSSKSTHQRPDERPASRSSSYEMSTDAVPAGFAPVDEDGEVVS